MPTCRRLPPAVEVAAPPPAEPPGRSCRSSSIRLHTLGAVRANVRYDGNGQLVDGGQVNAEQLRAPLQQRRDRPAHLLGRARSPPRQT
jgi:hypothetical protein